MDQHDSEDFTGFLLERYGYEFSYYNTKNDSLKPERENMFRVPLPRQSTPVTLQALLGPHSFTPGVTEEKIFLSTPPLLPIQLFRFEISPTGEALKVNTPVDFQIDTPIHIKVREGEKIVEKPYHLKSFVVHLGNTVNGGHYITYRRCSGHWICCNDATVRPATQEEVQGASRNAYTAFFEMA